MVAGEHVSEAATSCLRSHCWSKLCFSLLPILRLSSSYVAVPTHQRGVCPNTSANVVNNGSYPRYSILLPPFDSRISGRQISCSSSRGSHKDAQRHPGLEVLCPERCSGNVHGAYTYPSPSPLLLVILSSLADSSPLH